MLSDPTYAGVGGILFWTSARRGLSFSSIQPGRKSQQQESGVEVGLPVTPDGAPRVRCFRYCRE
jgi:hypothetical protein